MAREEQYSLAGLGDGKIGDDGPLLEELSLEPALLEQLEQQLRFANLISRALDPARSDTAFLNTLDAKLDGLDAIGANGDRAPSGQGDPLLFLTDPLTSSRNKLSSKKPVEFTSADALGPY